MRNPKVSIVILNFNTKELLENCLKSLWKVKNEADFEVIVVDNGSSDGSIKYLNQVLKRKKSTNRFAVIKNKENLGFAAGNNKAKGVASGEYVLFLNTDTIVHKDTIRETIKFINNNPEVGALTCKIILPDGALDKDSRRSFITPWIGLVHIFLKLDRLFPKSKVFAQYWYGYIDSDIIHEVDVIQGAYFLVRRQILNKVGWFDEDYFLDGEDVDLCWKIKSEGWKIIYYPKVAITHLKGATKGKSAKTFYRNNITLKEKLKFKSAGVNSMEIFLRKRLWNRYPKPFLYFVIIGIRLLKILRVLKLILYG